MEEVSRFTRDDNLERTEEVRAFLSIYDLYLYPMRRLGVVVVAGLCLLALCLDVTFLNCFSSAGDRCPFFRSSCLNVCNG
jgi:hypothetical protein